MNNETPDFNYLKRLWILKTVIDSGGLSQAALRNKVTISAISQSLTSLEDSVARKLLVRRNRKIQATPFCLELLKKTEPVFAAFAQMDSQNAKSCTVPPMSWLNFGISEHLACGVLPSLMASLEAQLPRLKLKLQVDRCDSLIKAVRRGELCMALVTDTGSISGVSRYPITEDRLGVFKAKGIGSKKSSKKLSLAVLRAPKEGHPTYYSRFLRSIADKTQIVLTCDNTEVLYSVACAGVAAALLPVKTALRAPGLLEEEPLVKCKPHEITMVSEKICDPLEDEFLVRELKSYFN